MHRPMYWLWRSLIIVSAVAVFAAGGYVIAHNDRVPQAEQMPGSTISIPAASPSATTTPTPGTPTPNTPGTTAAQGPRPTVAFLGDDYTVGTGASVSAQRFSTQLSASLGLSENNFGDLGTGYAKMAASGAGDYDSRVDAVAASRPALVIVSGGRNDVTDDLNTVALKATQLFADLRAKLPHALIVAIAPFWGDSSAPSELHTIAASVKQAVEAVHGVYLDVSDPLSGHPDWMADSTHPNDTGHAHLASALRPLLAPLISNLPPGA